MRAFLAFLTLIGITTVFAQNILLVDNTAGRPGGDHVFASLQTAIDSSKAGDIIHVRPSSIDYGSVTVDSGDDSISIYGIGFNPDKDGPLTSILTDLTVRANNIRISGLVMRGINAATSFSGGFTNLSIDNCQIEDIRIGNGSSEFYTNVIIRSCIIGKSKGVNTNTMALNILDGSSQVIITNNVISGDTDGFSSDDGSITCNGCIIKNNLFLGNGNALRKAFESLSNSTVSNNIFLGRSPVAAVSLFNNSFKNNFVTQASDSTFSTSNGNSTLGTVTSIVNFTDVFVDQNIVAQDTWDFSWDPTLSAIELINAGTDGTDIGITGSTIPFSSTGTTLPIIQTLTVPEVIKEGENLNVRLRAVGSN